MMDRLKQLAEQASNVTCSGPTIHPACPAPYCLFMAAATPAAIINLYERLEASELLAGQAMMVKSLVDGLAQSVEEKVGAIQKFSANAANRQDFQNDKEAK
jgi:hypothetical protein